MVSPFGVKNDIYWIKKWQVIRKWLVWFGHIMKRDKYHITKENIELSSWEDQMKSKIEVQMARQDISEGVMQWVYIDEWRTKQSRVEK